MEPRFGFGAVSNPCVTSHNHRHHVYWRLDFDIDDANNDALVKGTPITTEGMNVVSTEKMLVVVKDTVSGRGYRVKPGIEAYVSPIGSQPSWGGPTWHGIPYPFDVADAFSLQYKESSGVPLEVDDGVGLSSSQCAITSNFLDFINNEALDDNGDVVYWVRGGSWHAAGALNTCAVVGPDLYPIGDWN